MSEKTLDVLSVTSPTDSIGLMMMTLIIAAIALDFAGDIL